MGRSVHCHVLQAFRLSHVIKKFIKHCHNINLSLFYFTRGNLIEEYALQIWPIKKAQKKANNVYYFSDLTTIIEVNSVNFNVQTALKV